MRGAAHVRAGGFSAAPPLFLSRFPIGIAPVAIGLSGGLVVSDARGTFSPDRITRGCLGLGGGSLGFLNEGGCSAHPFLFLKLQFCAFCLPLFLGGGGQKPFFLTHETGRFCGLLCGAVGFE